MPWTPRDAQELPELVVRELTGDEILSIRQKQAKAAGQGTGSDEPCEELDERDERVVEGI